MKTNQFNLTTKRYTEEKVRSMMNNSQMLIGGVQVEDKFGDSGITGTFIIKSENIEEWKIDTFLLSCRVIGREVEQAMMSCIVDKAKKEGVKRILAEFISTKKNLPASNFLEKCGFENKGKYWVFDLSKEFKRPASISIDIK